MCRWRDSIPLAPSVLVGQIAALRSPTGRIVAVHGVWGRMRKPKNVANEIDAHVGSRLRLRRLLLGVSQERLGDALGLTFQQIQKYERGANRIGASRLYDLARAFDVPIGYFFDAM